MKAKIDFQIKLRLLQLESSPIAYCMGDNGMLGRDSSQLSPLQLQIAKNVQLTADLPSHVETETRLVFNYLNGLGLADAVV